VRWSGREQCGGAAWRRGRHLSHGWSTGGTEEVGGLLEEDEEAVPGSQTMFQNSVAL
jgi:hypothetical protein